LSVSSKILQLGKGIFKEVTAETFSSFAIELFQYQAENNSIYGSYLKHLGVDPMQIQDLREIPFMPVTFFKSHRILCGKIKEEAVFSSSGTTGMERSKHYIADVSLYEKSLMGCFSAFYGEPSSYRVLGLLPSYLEQEGSSLIYMVNKLMETGGYAESGFFLYDQRKLAKQLQDLSSSGLKTLLIGVSFALLDFAENYGFPLGENITVMETGGMKGRRREMTREELHDRLCKAFQKDSIHAEYGMTELLSQAYSRGQGRFYTPAWMKVLVRDVQDPFSLLPAGRTGGLNIIDLANVHSCAFVETQDIGRLDPGGGFEVLGRTDTSEARGCSLMVQ
jgi:phenylacetate-coenzyme A ligase PaaK-like adenylate-forming protein